MRGQSPPTLKPAAGRETAWWVVLAVALVVAGGRLWGLAHTPFKLLAAAREVGSIGQFYSTIQPSGSGRAVVYSQMTENGVGVFLHETAGGEPKLLIEKREKGRGWQRLGMLGWSPEDRLFALTVPPTEGDPAPPMAQLLLCDGRSGEVVWRSEIDALVMGFAWLHSNSFAVANSFNHDLSVFEKKREGAWVKRRCFKQVDTNDWRGLTAVSESALAWHSTTNIWRLDLDSGSPQLVWTSETNRLEGLSYRRDEKEFRIACTDEKGWLTVRLRENGQPIFGRSEDRRRCAWVRDEGGLNNLYVKTEMRLDPFRIEWHGALEDHQGPAAERLGVGKYLFGDSLWLVGNPLDQPTGIWRIVLEGGEPRCVVSGLKQPLRHALIRGPAQGGWLTNSAGVPMNWHLWEPRGRAANEKRPLIVTQTPYVWLPYAEVAAEAGYCFAMVDRPHWDDPTIYNWAEDVMALYNRLANNPQTDTNRVYVMGTSWDTSFLSSMLQERGALWQGLILINPGQFPDVSQLRRGARVFVAAGREQGDGRFAEQVRRFQESGLNQGIQARLCLQAGADHNPNSIATWRGRTVEFARFLNED